MEKVYKGHRVAWYIVGILGAIALYFDRYRQGELLLGTVYAFLWLAFTWLAFSVLISLADNKKGKLIQDCRAADFVAHGEKAFPKITSKHFRNLYCINLFVAYLDLDQPQKAVEYLMQVDTYFPDNLNGKIQEHAWYYNRCAYCMETGDLEQAERQLQLAEAVLSSEKLPARVKESLFLVNQTQRQEMKLMRGDYAGAEEYFSGLWLTEKRLRSKVFIQYTLAKIYRHNGETEKAREAALYVIYNGGQTRFVQRAQDLLLEMQ